MRVHYDVDVGGSYGVKRGIKHTVLCGYLARRLGFPIRLIEDRLENMRGGDAHGPERLFDVEVAFDDQGIVRSMKMRALENVGAYAGRSPFQLGKPIGAIVGPYKINSVQYRAVAVVTNKTTNDAVRGFGQGPTNLALERCMDEVANVLGLDPIELRRRNMIRHDEFPYLIPSGTTYDSGNYETVVDKVVADAGYEDLKIERDRLRGEGKLAGIGMAACLEPSGGNATFEALLNPAITTSTFMDSCRINIDGHRRHHRHHAHHLLGTGPRDAGRHRDRRSVAGRSRHGAGDAAGFAQFIAERHAGRLPHGDHARGRGVPRGAKAQGQIDRDRRARSWHSARSARSTKTARSATATRRRTSAPGPISSISPTAIIHRMPNGFEPGLAAEHIYQVPTGGTLPDKDGRVHMYPCFAFEFHLLLVSIDPDLGRPEIVKYRLGHDCGTQINPKIVRGMTMGGIAHGIGAALYEEFAYNDEGQLIAQTFMDYLLPSSHEVPAVEIVDHETPSPHTVLGQKGSGESGYLGAPAAIANAVNDAIRPLGISINTLPIKVSKLGDLIAEAQEKIKVKKGN